MSALLPRDVGKGARHGRAILRGRGTPAIFQGLPEVQILSLLRVRLPEGRLDRRGAPGRVLHISEQLRSKILEIPETPKKTVNTLEIQHIDNININARSTLRSDLRTALPRRPDTRLVRVSRSAISSMGHSIKQRLYFFSKRYIQLVARCIRSRHRARAAFVALAGANL